MKKIFLLVIASYLLMNSNLYSQAGKSGLAFLKDGVSGRALGMGEAYTAIASDPAATFYNPAALSLSQNAQLLLMHKEWIADTRTEFIGASVPMDRFSFGFSLNATGVADIQVRTQPGDALGTFTSHNVSIGFSAAYQIDRSLDIGITGKYLYEKIFIEDASGYGIDIGGLYRTPWDFDVALAINNLGSMNKLQYEATKLPLTVRGGIAYQVPVENIDSKLTFASDVVTFTRENKTHLHLGTELNYKNLFALRLGYQTGYDAKNISSGIGIHYHIFQLDYAFVPFRYDFGSTHTLSLGFEF
jgi:hypothetical protein